MREYYLTAAGFEDINSYTPTFNRGFLYGDGFFETMLARNGGIEFWAIHANRMKRTAEALKINMPSAAVLSAHLTKVIAELPKEKSYRMRITCFRSGVGKYRPQSLDGSLVLQVEELKDFRLAHQPLSWKLASRSWFYNPFDQYKLIGKHQQVLLSVEAMEAGVDELLVWNHEDHLVSLISGNLLALIDAVWYTPTLSAGALNGTIRQVLINAGLLVEKDISLGMLERVESMVRTNSVSGLQLLQGAKYNVPYQQLKLRFEALALNSIQDFLGNRP